MNILEKLDKLMAEHNIDNSKDMARMAGVPYTTIRSMYQRGGGGLNEKHLRKLALLFDCSMDYLLRDENTDRNHKPFDYNDLTPREKKMVDTYIRAQNSENPTVKTLVDLIDKELGIGERTDGK